MLRHVLFTLIAIFILSFIGCVHNKVELSKISHLQYKTDSLLKITENISIDTINNITNSIKEKMSFFANMDSLLKNVKHQSIVTNWSYLNNFFDMKKREYFSIKSGLESSKKQLSDLSDDIKNNVWKEEELEEFVIQEGNVVDMYNHKIKSFNQDFENKVKKYYALLPQIIAITDSINTAKVQ